MSETVTLYRKNDSWKRGEWQAICVRHDVAGQFRRIQWCRTHKTVTTSPEGEAVNACNLAVYSMSFRMTDCRLVEVWQEVTP